MNIVSLVLFFAFLGSLQGFSLPSNRHARSGILGMTTTDDISLSGDHSKFLKEVAKIDPPKRLPTLIKLLSMDDNEELVQPTERQNLNPFLIPLSKSKKDGSYLCYIRWPTQKEDMDLQIVRTTETGIELVAMGTDQWCHRQIATRDFYGDKSVEELTALLNKDGSLYTVDDYMPFLKSGKFDSTTTEGLSLVLDRYLLTKVGAFPDCFERLAEHFLEEGSQVSALVTCERAVSVFYGWGHPMSFHANMLNGITDRQAEARDAARAAVNMPLWTVAKSAKSLDELAILAGFTGSKILGEMHAFRAQEKREEEIGEGLSPLQVTLDQAAHLMDAIALGAIEGGWNAETKKLISEKYEEGYPEMAKFILG
jgi:hypothetical protein